MAYNKLKDVNEEDILEFTATITYQRFYDEDKGWGVFGFRTIDNIPFYIQQDKSTQFNPYITEEDKRYDNNIENYKFSELSGNMQHLTLGIEYNITAVYQKHSKYGNQYIVISAVGILPKTLEEQKTFLKSLIQARYVDNLLQEYPNVVEDVVNGDLTEIEYNRVKGVGKITWNKIKDTILNNYCIADILTMLSPLGVTYKMIKTLCDSETNPSLLKQKIMNNPYILTSINGLGFKRVDDLALKIKPELEHSEYRLIAYIDYFLTELSNNDGHTWVSKTIVANNVSNNIPQCMDLLDDLYNHSSNFLYVNNNTEIVGLQRLRNVEKNIFKELLRKSRVPVENTSVVFSDDEINKAIEDSQKEQGFEYTDEQKDKIINALNCSFCIIGGVSGGGKSSIARAIFKAYRNKHLSISGCALSAMASKRLSEATNYPCGTIHRTLSATGNNSFEYNKDNQLICDLVYLDEASMVNASLMYSLISSIRDSTRLILCGDWNQLPPIGFGNVFYDVINSTLNKYINIFLLITPMRQALDSGILEDANMIRENKNPIIKPEPKIIHGKLKDMFYMFRDNRESLRNIAINTFLKSVEEDGIDNCAIIVPRREGCINSCLEINKIVQDKIINDDVDKIEVFDDLYFKLGAKVMQTVNDYDKNIFNGEIGYITKIYEDYENKKLVPFIQVTYKYLNIIIDDYDNKVIYEEQSKIVVYSKKELNQLDLAYANTVHKVQGQSIKSVIGIIDNTHYNLLDSCMLYTLLTRAKKRCCLCAEPQAFLKCIKTKHNERNTWLQIIDINEIEKSLLDDEQKKLEEKKKMEEEYIASKEIHDSYKCICLN